MRVPVPVECQYEKEVYKNEDFLRPGNDLEEAVDQLGLDCNLDGLSNKIPPLGCSDYFKNQGGGVALQALRWQYPTSSHRVPERPE
jgi:hypothetical protein